MKQVLYIIIFVVGVFFSKITQAQINAFGLNYMLGTTLGNSRDFVKAFSFRGASMQYTYIPRNQKIGFYGEVSWNHIGKTLDREPYKIEEATVISRR